MNKRTPDILKKEKFERLIQPYSDTKLAELKDEVFQNYTMRVIHTWQGYHLCDEERLKACIKVNVQPKIENVDFINWIEAALYICSVQLKREDLTNEYKKYIIGQNLNLELLNRSDSRQSDAKTTVALQLASKLYLASATVIKYSVFASAVDDIFETDAELAKKILMNEIKVSHENIIELSRLKGEEIRAVSKSVGEDGVDRLTYSYIRNTVKWKHYQEQKETSSRRVQREEKKFNKPAIRQMPEYDPDSEVNSLCMTIDSWVSSIQRVNNKCDLSKITNKASLNLMKKLSFLEHTIHDIQDSLVERTGV